MNKIQESEKIYHSCLNKNKDGSNRLFKKGDRCCTLTNSSCWKRAWDVTSGVRTRSQEKTTRKIDVEGFDSYFRNFWNIHRWMEANDSIVETDELSIVLE